MVRTIVVRLGEGLDQTFAKNLDGRGGTKTDRSEDTAAARRTAAAQASEARGR